MKVNWKLSLKCLNHPRVSEIDDSYLMLYFILFNNFHLTEKDFIAHVVGYDLIFAGLLGK